MEIVSLNCDGRNKRLYGIQVVRGIACLGILIAHSCAYAEMNFDGFAVASTLDFFGRYGFLYFTEIFFAISGFFLSASIDKINDGVKWTGARFAFNKFLRIYPIYWVAVAAAILLRLVVQNEYTSSSNFIKTFFLLPFANVPYVLNIEWTLLVEVMFFIVAALFAAPRRKKYFPVAIVIWGCVILFAIVAGKASFAITLTAPGIFVAGCGLSFICGTVVYYGYKRFLRDKLQIAEIPGSIFIAALFVLFLLNYQFLLQGNPAMLLGRIFHYIILASLVICAACSSIHPTSALVFVGNYSYVVYLIHPTILDLSFYLFNAWGYEFKWWMCIVACSASLIAGIALGKVEHWLNAGIKKGIAQAQNIPWKKYTVYCVVLALTIGCFVTMKGVKDMGKMNRERPSDYISESFDVSLVATTPNAPGWIDTMEVATLPDGTLLLSASGWAYDSLANVQAERIVVLSAGESVPVSIAWYDRPGVREALGIPVPVSCGFTLQAKPIPAEDDIAVFVISEDGHYLRLLYLE